MASTLRSLASYSRYKDRYFKGTLEEYREALDHSCTLYVGNLSFFTTEEQIYEVFSRSGDIRRIIMGLDSKQKTPCGFCFVEFYRRADALDCMKYINSTKLDDRTIRTDLDPGFVEGRQYGRGTHGGQVRDEFRMDFDEGRGGYGLGRRRGGQYDSFDAPLGGGLYTGALQRARREKRRAVDEAGDGQRRDASAGVIEEEQEERIEVDEFGRNVKRSTFKRTARGRARDSDEDMN